MEGVWVTLFDRGFVLICSGCSGFGGRSWNKIGTNCDVGMRGLVIVGTILFQ